MALFQRFNLNHAEKKRVRADGVQLHMYDLIIALKKESFQNGRFSSWFRLIHWTETTVRLMDDTNV